MQNKNEWMNEWTQNKKQPQCILDENFHLGEVAWAFVFLTAESTRQKKHGGRRWWESEKRTSWVERDLYRNMDSKYEKRKCRWRGKKQDLQRYQRGQTQEGTVQIS